MYYTIYCGDMTHSRSAKRLLGQGIVALCWAVGPLFSAPADAQNLPSTQALSEKPAAINPYLQRRIALKAQPASTLAEDGEAPDIVTPSPKIAQAKHESPSEERKSFAGNPAARYAPSISPEELSALTPAAGGEESAPLIPTPPAGPAIIPDPPPVVANAEPAATPASSPPPLTPLLAATPETTAATLALAPPEKPGAAQSSAQPAAEVATSEPEAEVSKQSKAILKKIPSKLDAQKGGVSKFTVDHAKDASTALQEGVTKPTEETVKHEAMGIKIEVKKQQIAYANYESSKAYDALISGNTTEAIEIYKNVLANDPNNKNALFGLATTYHRAGQIEMARPLYGKLLSLDPDNRDALNNFLVLVADESPEAAMAELEKLENRNPDFSPIPAQMAVIYQKMGNLDKASEKMFRAVALAPENLTYRYNLAIMMDRQHNYQEAAKLYRQLVDASNRGEKIPGNPAKIQERLTFISSNRP